jgi:hypothetical protein
MTIDGESGNAECVPEYDVCRLAADAGELHERLDRRRHLTGMMLGDGGCHANQRARLGPEKSCGLNLRFEFRG